MPSSPPSSTPFGTPGLPYSIDSPDMRRAGRELLSLALIDARNHTLHLLSLYEQALGASTLAVPRVEGVDPPIWVGGHLAGSPSGGSRAIRSAPSAPIARCVRRGWPRSSRRPTRGGIPRSARRPTATRPTCRIWRRPRPTCSTPSESTLELLEHAAETDAGLYFYRLALFHEDLRGEQLLVMAQTLGLPLAIEMPPAAVTRPPSPAARTSLVSPSSPSCIALSWP